MAYQLLLLWADILLNEDIFSIITSYYIKTKECYNTNLLFIHE